MFYFTFEMLLKYLLQGKFPRVLTQNLCTLFAGKGEGDGPRKVAIS